jgi:hypothetical protein
MCRTEADQANWKVSHAKAFRAFTGQQEGSRVLFMQMGIVDRRMRWRNHAVYDQFFVRHPTQQKRFRR